MLGCDTFRPDFVINSRTEGSSREKPHFTGPGEELREATSFHGTLQ